jgi:hypothetical protein
MNAPLYLPAQEYEEPGLVPMRLGVNDIAIVDLMRSGAARAIVDQEIPGLSSVIRTPQLQATLTNVTLTELSRFSFASRMISKEGLDRVDARLRALSAQEWPGL